MEFIVIVVITGQLPYSVTDHFIIIIDYDYESSCGVGSSNLGNATLSISQHYDLFLG